MSESAFDPSPAAAPKTDALASDLPQSVADRWAALHDLAVREVSRLEAAALAREREAALPLMERFARSMRTPFGVIVLLLLLLLLVGTISGFLLIQQANIKATNLNATISVLAALASAPTPTNSPPPSTYTPTVPPTVTNTPVPPTETPTAVPTLTSTSTLTPTVAATPRPPTRVIPTSTRQLVGPSSVSPTVGPSSVEPTVLAATPTSQAPNRQPTNTPKPPPTDTPIIPTDTPVTPSPPTNTPTPTDTPVTPSPPTNTPTPTNTPVTPSPPTNTPIPPKTTNTPTPFRPRITVTL